MPDTGKTVAENSVPRNRIGPRRDPNKRHLNEPFIKSLKPQAGPYLVWDLKQRGLAIRVQPSGHLSFKVIYSRHGRPRWFSLGHADIGIAKARKEAAKILVQVDDGNDPAADRKAERGAGTFAELVDEYRDYAKTKNKSWAQGDGLVRKHLLPRWGKLQPANITQSDAEVRIKKIKAPIVANQTLAAGSAIFTWAIKKKKAGVKINPFVGVDRNATKSRERVLSDTEIPEFWNAFDGVGLMEGAALKTILLTGQRPGEVTHMRTEHIENGWWKMPGDPVAKLDWPGTKNGLSHRVWLPQAVQDIITGLEPTGLVFAAVRGGVITNLDLTMRAICKQLGLVEKEDRATPHDLRRTFGTKVTGLRHGRDSMDRVLNHKEGKKKVTDIYDRYEYAEEDKFIMESVAANLMALIDGSGAANVIAFGKAK
jgi:integrase